MIIRREWAMPNANTFSIKPIKEFIEDNIQTANVIIDPFANSCKIGTIRNDLNPAFDTQYHLDALEFLKKMESESADVILYDPPYNASQAKECYDSFGAGKLEINVSNNKYWSECKKEVARILRKNGVVMCFGWNSGGIGKNLGMEMTDILMVCHGGNHYDTICTKEIKVDGAIVASKKKTIKTYELF